MNTLNARQYQGLLKLGDCLVPGDDDLPAFSKSNCATEADRIMNYMPAGDRKDLGMLLTLLSVLPQFIVMGFVRLLELSPKMRGPLGGALRFIRLGIRGLIMTLYYSYPPIQKRLGFEVSVYTSDMPKGSTSPINEQARL